MKCRKCKGENLITLDSITSDPEGIRHDRKCTDCGTIWGLTKAMMIDITPKEQPKVRTKLIKIDGKTYIKGDLFKWEALYRKTELVTAYMKLGYGYEAFFNFNEDESGVLVLEYDDIDYGHEMNFSCFTLNGAEKIVGAFLDGMEIIIDKKYRYV